MIKLNIQNETAQLEAVVLGTAESPGPTPKIEDAYDPKSRLFIEKGEYPLEKDMIPELDAFQRVFFKHGVKVYRPDVLKDVNQIFARDISFVIGNTLVVSNVIGEREDEIKGIQYILDQIAPDSILNLPENARVEGGDVMPWNGKLFVGYSEDEDFEKYKVSRTNRAGVEFLKKHFPNWEIHAFELRKSDLDPYENALHLDCCFQPIGRDQAIMYPGGFKNVEDAEFLIEYFGKEKIIEISSAEMYQMFSNVFSISESVIVSEKGFGRLNKELKSRGFTVEEVPFYEISKQEGLLRCATMPLRRKL
jgi:N-dimethylarginine dimethylaminohydrolase